MTDQLICCSHCCPEECDHTEYPEPCSLCSLDELHAQLSELRWELRITLTSCAVDDLAGLRELVAELRRRSPGVSVGNASASDGGARTPRQLLQVTLDNAHSEALELAEKMNDLLVMMGLSGGEDHD